MAFFIGEMMFIIPNTYSAIAFLGRIFEILSLKKNNKIVATAQVLKPPNAWQAASYYGDFGVLQKTFPFHFD